MSQLGPRGTDPQPFLAELVASVNTALVGAETSGFLTVERNRSLGDRLARRPGTITALRFATSSEELSLSYSPGPRWNADVARVSGGVKISRRSVPLGEWLTTLAGRVAAAAADREGDAAAAAGALERLGIQPAGADIQVEDDTLIADLHALPARLNGRIPEAAVASVQKIGELLADTLSRVEGSGEAEMIVRRTATMYLPDTLRVYLSLPAEWVRGHVFRDGTTAEQSFVAQLSTIEAAAGRLYESALENDASALLNNGRFLSSRFPSSSLDL